MRSLARASSRSRSCERDVETMQGCARARFGLAQFRQGGSGDRLALRSLDFRLDASRDGAHAKILGVLGFGDLIVRGRPAQVIERRLGLAHLRRHGAIADRLAGLLLQSVDLRCELADDVFGAQEIGLCRLQSQLGFMAAGMQAGNAGGFFQDAAALLGLGLDDLADAALMHEGRRARAGRGVGEQDLDVARADLARR